MLFNKSAIVPFPATREEKPEPVDNPFAEIFAPPDISEASITAAARAVQKAVAAVKAANDALADSAKKFPPRVGFGGEMVEHAAVAAARQTLSRAEDARRAAQDAMAAAVQQRGARFERDVMERFDKAAPLIAELAETLGDAIEPMVALHSLAYRYRLQVPRLLAHVPVLKEAVLVLTQIANAGIAPNLPVASLGDE
jgi:hypothetical protein